MQKRIESNRVYTLHWRRELIHYFLKAYRLYYQKTEWGEQFRDFKVKTTFPPPFCPFRRVKILVLTHVFLGKKPQKRAKKG